ncbi:hypothetical protein VE03_05466 [Pseudogymnoascus sp. 23342-1-I1]|nr:hypothetical protein VE03_05466 [Pseudogymnoascus sp. 23342-1-I1]
MPDHGPNKQVVDAVATALLGAFAAMNTSGTTPIRSLDDLVVDSVATATSKVTPSDLASNIAHSRDVGFPEVLATANMLSLMEIASARVLTPYLSGTQTSVATRTDVAHLAATPLGAQIGKARMWRAVTLKEGVENSASQRQPQHVNSDEKKSKQKYIRVQLRSNTATGIPAPRIPWRHGGEKDIHRIVEEGPDKLTERWLKGGADLTALDIFGWTALHVAARYRSVKISRLMLKGGADANAATACGMTVLFIAVASGRADTVKLLLDNGADPKGVYGSRNTLLHTAVENIGDEMLDVLLERGLEPNAQNSDMWTPLHVAVKNRSPSKVKILLKHGADPNISEDESWTSLHLAVDSGDDWIVKILLENGADSKSENIRGDTPLKLAVRIGNERMVKALLEKGVDPSLGYGRCTAVEWMQGHPVSGLSPPARALRPPYEYSDASSITNGAKPRICGLPDPLDNKFPCLSAYLELFEEYSRRELRYDGDALRAFYGPLFAGMKTPSVEGLPGFYVKAFMLFTSPRADLRRRREFGSFSWTGWAGELKWPRENLIWYDEDRQRTQSLSNIFKWLDRNEIAEWSVSETAVDQGHIDKLSIGRRRLQGESNLVELLREYPHLFDNETVEARRWYRDRKARDVFSPGPVWEKEISKMETPKAGSKTEKPIRCMYAMRSVNSQAESIRFIERMDWGPPPEYLLRSWNAYHRCHQRKAQAMCNLDFMKDIRFLDRDWHVALRPNTAVSGHTNESIAAVLSRCQTPIYGSALLGIEKERMPEPRQPWDLLWVMHVEWREGVAERRGVGQVFVGALEEAVGRPEVKMVDLG